MLCPSPSSRPVFHHISSKSIFLKSGEWFCGCWGLQGTGCAGMGITVCLDGALPAPGAMHH